MQPGPSNPREQREASHGSEGGMGEPFPGRQGEFARRRHARERSAREERRGDGPQDWGAQGWGYGTGPGSTGSGDPGLTGGLKPERYGHEAAGRSGPEPSFAGRGPKGYRRSDERICEDVCDQLTDDSHVDARDIMVGVDQGVVILEGTVGTRQEKREAEFISERVPGVVDVRNQLRVASGAPLAGRREGSGTESPKSDDLGTGPQGSTTGSRT